MSDSALVLLRSEYGHAWEICDWYGGWVAYRRAFWSPDVEARGICNVLGADSLEDLAGQLAAQAAAEARFYGRRAIPPQRPPGRRRTRETAR